MHLTGGSEFATKLGTWRMAIIAVTILATACSKSAPPQQLGTVAAPAANELKPTRTTVSLDDVFAWRRLYGDLLGKSKDAAIERLGAAFAQPVPGVLRWHVTPKAGDREISIGFDSAATVFAVKVAARADETLDPLEILRKAPLFSFETGTFQDSAESYMTVRTKDKRNEFHFSVGNFGVVFRWATFIDSENANVSAVFNR